LLAGIAGFIPALLSPPERDIAVDAMHGRLFGLFPVNVLHNLFHIAFGFRGIAVWRSFDRAHFYARAVAVTYGVLVIAGLIPGLNTLFGLVPLYGHDVWLHALIALPAAYLGFVASERPALTPGA